jgi:hypothetical protein
MNEETRLSIYNKLKHNLEKFAPPMVSRDSKENGDFELIGNKPVPYGHDKKIVPGMYFASVAHRKDSVAFYFFPAYMDQELKKIAPSLVKYLKGKTCFHFKKEEQVDVIELNELLKRGIDAWTKAGYMK